jgi:hypothetical protein
MIMLVIQNRANYRHLKKDVLVVLKEFILVEVAMKKFIEKELALGHCLSKTVLESINYDLKNTIFSYIPNTAEVAFYGLVKGMEEYLNKIKVERILSWNGNVQ